MKQNLLHLPVLSMRNKSSRLNLHWFSQGTLCTDNANISPSGLPSVKPPHTSCGTEQIKWCSHHMVQPHVQVGEQQLTENKRQGAAVA